MVQLLRLDRDDHHLYDLFAFAGELALFHGRSHRTAVDDVRLRVLDGVGRRVPVGVPGELYIGALLWRVVTGRDPISPGAIRSRSFSSQPGARLYRTGDRVL